MPFRRLFTRIFFNSMLALFAALVALGSVFLNYVWHSEYENGKNRMLAETEAIAKYYLYCTEGKILPSVLMEMIKDSRVDSDVWLIGLNGVAIQLSGLPSDLGPKGENILQTETVAAYLRRALTGGKSFTLEGDFDTTFGGVPIVTVVAPLYARDGAVGAVFLHRKLDLVRADLQALYRGTNPAILVAVFVGLLLSYMTSMRITRPLSEMARAARRLADGDMSTRVHVYSTDEINELASAFNSMVEDLSRMEDVRRGFVANVSHELRSPITSIAGYLQGMLDGTIPENEYKRYMKVVLDETQRLSRLIRDLLDLSRIESGAFPLNVVDFELNELLRRVLIKFDGRLEEKNMKVELDFCEDPLRVRADIDRIEQVLSNLVDNALKYCGQYGSLKIETKSLGKKIECVVADDGAGIAQGDLPHVFERFYKADKAHTAGLGTGLGLSIVKKIIEQHGESIMAQSREGEGAVFRFTLERAQTLPVKKGDEIP